MKCVTMGCNLEFQNIADKGSFLPNQTIATQKVEIASALWAILGAIIGPSKRGSENGLSLQVG